MPNHPPDPFGFHFDNSYAKLPEEFYTRQKPVPVPSAASVVFNRDLARDLGLGVEALQNEGTAIFSGNQIPLGADPLAQAYAGHQFAHLTMLGDGRAVLLGEHVTKEGRRFDVQLKGSGQTVYSRRGDGRAAMGPMIREYVVSEAMHALGVPTTRSLAVVSTGEPVFREQPLPGAVLTRIAASHIRVGTFEYAYHYGLAHQKPGLVKQLADYAIARHFPEAISLENPYLVFLRLVSDRQAALIASWMSVGFIHGVMNTDNMAISGETIDYGPCAFMDEFSADKVFSSIDQRGRYAYHHQPAIAQWNLARLAECLLPLLDKDHQNAVVAAQGVLATFKESFSIAWLRAMRAKLGLFNEESADQTLVDSLLEQMQSTGADFTNSFRQLGHELNGPREWQESWKARLSRQPQPWSEVKALMKKHNPAVIPRNHQIEAVIQVAQEQSDFAPLIKLNAALKKPYEALAEFAKYQVPPTETERVQATFCGT